MAEIEREQKFNKVDKDLRTLSKLQSNNNRKFMSRHKVQFTDFVT